MTNAQHRANVRRAIRAARKVNGLLLRQVKGLDQKLKTLVNRKTDIELGEMGALTVKRDFIQKGLQSLDYAFSDVLTIMGTW